MVKKFGVWYTIKYYRVIQLAVFGIALLISKPYICKLLKHLCSFAKPTSKLYDNLNKIIPLALLGLFMYTVYNVYQSRTYKYITGRNYSNDHNNFNRSYNELTKYFKDAEPHKLDMAEFPQIEWKNAKGIIFGKYGRQLITIPSDSECNIAIFGPPGSGKTSGVAITNAMEFEGSVLAVDIKGDVYNYVSKNSERKIVRFCPDSPTALKDSCHFDPLAGINNMELTDRKLYIESMSIVLIADEGGADSSYFTSRARKIFQGIAHLLLHENPDTSFPQLVHAILKGNVFKWVEYAVSEQCTCETAKELLASFLGNNEKNITAAYDVITTALVHFSNPVLDKLLDNKGGNCISIKTLEDGYDIYLQISQEHLDAYAPLFTMIIQSLSTAFTKRADSSTGVKNRPILMLLDEFPQLTFTYKMINSNLSTLRSKSVICMIIQQNLAQLEHRFQPTGARSIIGNCNYQIILGSNDINSSKVYSDTFGVKKVLKVSNSQTFTDKATNSKSVQEATEKVFMPEYFGDLSAENKMIIYFKGKYCECSKINCYKD